MRKLQKIACILVFTVVVFLTAGIVTALDSGDASATVYWSTDAFHPTASVGYRITFNSNTDQQIEIQQIGIHIDWMADGAFSGKDLTSNPVTIPGHGNYTTDPIMFQVPYNVSVGSHTYFVGVDGVDSSGNFTWNGPNETIQVSYVSTDSTTPNPTPTPGGSGSAGSPPSITTYILIIAVVAIIIAVAVIVMELRKKPQQPAPAAEKTAPATDKPAPAPETGQPPPQKEDNYDI